MTLSLCPAASRLGRLVFRLHVHCAHLPHAPFHRLSPVPSLGDRRPTLPRSLSAPPLCTPTRYLFLLYPPPPPLRVDPIRPFTPQDASPPSAPFFFLPSISPPPQALPAESAPGAAALHPAERSRHSLPPRPTPDLARAFSPPPRTVSTLRHSSASPALFPPRSRPSFLRPLPSPAVLSPPPRLHSPATFPQKPFSRHPRPAPLRGAPECASVTPRASGVTHGCELDKRPNTSAAERAERRDAERSRAKQRETREGNAMQKR